jgi:hypothetical protein
MEWAYVRIVGAITHLGLAGALFPFGGLTEGRTSYNAALCIARVICKRRISFRNGHFHGNHIISVKTAK